MIVFPNAKINIGLDILSRRPDGYHNIHTAMFPVPWTDILEIVPAKGADTTLTVTGRAVECPPEKNLVMKAHNALNAYTPLPPLDIYLHKVIPDGAGLGGGSADAAFTLTAINQMLSLDIPQTKLAEIAATIGADCPFFIYNRPMLASSTGTELTPIDLSLAGNRILIVKPPVLVPTKEAYAGVTPSIPEHSLDNLLSVPMTRWQGMVKNDFEPTIMRNHPIIAAIKNAMIDAGAMYAAMSGSGSAVFGLWEGDNMADPPSELIDGCATFSALL